MSRLNQARNAALDARAKRASGALASLPADVTASRAVTLMAETMLVTLARTCVQGRRGNERLASAGIRVRRTRAPARDAAASAQWP